MGNGIQAYLYSLDKVEAGDMPYEIDGAAATPVRGALRQQLVERIARAFPFLNLRLGGGQAGGVREDALRRISSPCDCT